MQFLSFSDNLLQDDHHPGIIILFFDESVDNFDITHKTCSISIVGAGPPLLLDNYEIKSCNTNYGNVVLTLILLSVHIDSKVKEHINNYGNMNEMLVLS